MKNLRSFLLAVCSLATASASATTVIPPTFDELVGRAELIFEGTVKDVRAQWVGEGSQRHIMTYVTFDVAENVKGQAPQTYTLQMLGGTVGDMTMEVTDTPTFAPGDREILFVENNGRQFVPLVGIMHGRFHIARDGQTGNEILADDHGDVVRDLTTLGRESLPDAATPVVTDEPMTAVAFKAAIRTKLAAEAK